MTPERDGMLGRRNRCAWVLPRCVRMTSFGNDQFRIVRATIAVPTGRSSSRFFLVCHPDATRKDLRAAVSSSSSTVVDFSTFEIFPCARMETDNVPLLSYHR